METLLTMESVRYVRDGKEILKDVSLSILPGQRWAMMGHNGSGKSVLLKLAAGYILSNGGRITRLGGEDGKTDLRELRKNIGYIGRFIDHGMHPAENALEAVISGAFATIGIYQAYTEAEADRARRMMELTGIGHLERRTFSKLSDGERDRVLLARALMADLRLLLLDEPCAALDLRGSEEFLIALSDICREIPSLGIIMVSHHIEEITPLFTHALLIREGRITSQGEASEVLTSPFLTSALGVPVEVGAHDGRRNWRIVSGRREG